MIKKMATAGFCFALAACGEDVTETYDTWAEADQAGAIDRGWIPDFVPRTAHQIREEHNLDTNAQTLTVTIPANDASDMVAGLNPVVSGDKQAAAQLARNVGWENRQALRADAYIVCSSIWPGVLLVDRQSGSAIYKTPAKWLSDDCGMPV